MGAVAGTIGSLQAMEAVKYIIGEGDLLTGRMLVYDALKRRLFLSGSSLPFLQRSRKGFYLVYRLQEELPEGWCFLPATAVKYMCPAEKMP